MMPLAMLNTPNIGKQPSVERAVVIHKPSRDDGFPQGTHGWFLLSEGLAPPFTRNDWYRLCIDLLIALLSSSHTPQRLIGHHLLSGWQPTCRRQNKKGRLEAAS
jgi:hypothetical protein